MDKFLLRNPTWKTKTYGSVVASSSSSVAAKKIAASPIRRPLQDSNLGDTRSKPTTTLPSKSQSQALADDQKARDQLMLKQNLAAIKATSQHRSEFQKDQNQDEATAPEAAQVPPSRIATPTRQEGQWARLQQDLNSPNAALRLRAIRALKSPTKSAYNTFDVPIAEQSIITMEERNPPQPLSLPELLKDIVVYVEVRTGNDNRSEGVKTIISKMGAQVKDRLTRTTTHVVFKDGLLSTYKKAVEWKIPVVSILWIEACKVQRKICDPSQFPISNIRMYEYPELFGKIPRVKFMQPDSELSQKPRKRQGTPTSSKDNESGSAKKRALPETPTTTTPKNDISRFFRSLNRKPSNDEGVESPATKLLNRISSGCYTPLGAVGVSQQKETNGSGDAGTEKVQAQKSLQFGEQAGNNTPQPNPSSTTRPRRSTVEPPPVMTPPVRTSRRRSCVAEIGSPAALEPKMTRRRSSLHVSVVVKSIQEDPSTALEPRMTRRRSSLLLASTPTEESEQKQIIETIAEELAPIQENRNSIVMTQKKIINQTDIVEQSIEMSAVESEPSYKADRRGTLYAAESMDISASRRRSVATSSSDLTNVTTQTSISNVEEPLTPLFSSTRLPSGQSTGNRRRTIFNLDMEVINESIERLNQSHRRSLALANEAELGECRQVTQEPPQAEANLSQEPKRRRLFNPNDEVVISPPKSSRKSRLSIIGSSSSVQKRRRSLATPAKTSSSEMCIPVPVPNPITTIQGENSNKKETPEASINGDLELENSISTAEEANDKPKSKPRSRTRTLVHTNMRKEQVQVIQKALRKLRGMRHELTVTERTTHLVSLEPRRTLNLLRGLMRGVWIVSYQWVLASIRAGKWIREEPYELTRFSRAIEICRTERQAFGKYYKCELFRFMEPFYVSSLCRPMQFNNMKELLILGGATLTENRFKAKYVIGDKRRAEDERIYLDAFWVLDSITCMQIQKFGKYLMKSAIITAGGIRYEDPRERDEDSHSHRRHDYVDPPLVMDK
ncbi:microcephalin [Drosophila eugracilis]|uniref:microcephalin n=1 Tax=Drosophila eugracilis TaxID=29029 RepID=UPI0007E6C30B|nr:microcephalin [Drosophila eugracilis]